MKCRYSVIFDPPDGCPRNRPTDGIVPRATVRLVDTRRRRRIDAVLLAGAAVLAGVAGFAGATVAAGERVTGLWAGARVGGGGDARILEVVDYDFGSRRRPGPHGQRTPPLHHRLPAGRGRSGRPAGLGRGRDVLDGRDRRGRAARRRPLAAGGRPLRAGPH